MVLAALLQLILYTEPTYACIQIYTHVIMSGHISFYLLPRVVPDPYFVSKHEIRYYMNRLLISTVTKPPQL